MEQDQRKLLGKLLCLARDEYLEGLRLGDDERRRRGEWLMDWLTIIQVVERTQRAQPNTSALNHSK